MNKLNLLKKSGTYYPFIGLLILGIAVIHFSTQVFFIQTENLRSEKIPTVSEVKNTLPAKNFIQIEPEQYEIEKIEQYKIEKIKVITIPETVKTTPFHKKETIPQVRKSIKKKEVIETRAERLRRAERLLTGV